MKNSRRIQVVCLILLTVISASAQRIALNPEIEKKIDKLLSQMTLEEKLGQMTQFSGTNPAYEGMIREGKIGSLLNIRGAKEVNRLQRIAVKESRLGIPLILGNDVIHGYRTIYPIPLACAASWDTALVRQAAAVAAEEARAEGTHWTFAPMVDIARDARWGRIAEGAGEDPFLGSAIAKALVTGFQGKTLAGQSSVLACAKHFVGYGAAEGGRDYNTTDMSERTLREIYLPPFKSAVYAGAGSLMSAFNDLSGIPASANHFTLADVLKNEWQFNGFVVSDWNSIGELVAHGIASNTIEAGVAALKAGVDMDMEGRAYSDGLAMLIKQGEIPMSFVDDAVRRILRMKFELGLFDQPYTDETLAKSVILSPENLKIARNLAVESFVLLKNDRDLLPLAKNLKTLAVIGALADDQDALLGTWECEGKAADVVSILQGIRSAVGKTTKVLYEQGCPVVNENRSGFASAIAAAKNADAVIIVLGESRNMSGEAASRAELNLPGVQEELVKEIIAVGKPVVVVLIAGRPLTIPWLAENAQAILMGWAPGIQGGNAVADVLFGDANPGGKLPVTFPRSVGQIPIYYNHKNTGKPANAFNKFSSKYIDEKSTPLFPFGFGLSYTTFKYSGLKVIADRLTSNDTLKVRVNLMNSGKRKGAEVAQLYIRDLVANVTRPVKELKGFRRVELQPGEEKTIEFAVPVAELGFYDSAMKYIVEPGKFEVMVGGNSDELLMANFEVISSENK
ncbi:MAG: beta-glucosidase BglX [Candidatus Neomarinimicrobiota bacterium]